MNRSGSKKTVLVVDDERAWIEILSLNLLKFGFKAIHASNGEEGLKIALREKPELVVLDIVMPKMDGLTVMKKLRGDTWGKKVPIVLFTSLMPNEEMMRRISVDKPALYLIKTEHEPEEVVGKIHEIIGA